MSLLKLIRQQLGLSATPANNFTLDASADDGTMKLARGNAGATTQDVLTVDANGGVGARGVADNSDAATGFVGEYLETTSIYSTIVINSTTGRAAQLLLTAGDWDVQGLVTFSATSATVTMNSAYISVATDGQGSANSVAAQLGGISYSSGASGPLGRDTIVTRVSLTAPALVLLNHMSYFNAGSMSVNSVLIRARRVR